MLLILILSLSVSLDTLGVSIAYAMAGIGIPKRSRVLVAVINGGITGMAVFAGAYCLTEVPDFWFSIFGGCILILLGIKSLWNVFFDSRAAQYDRDHSRSIDLKEGCFLGLALSLDSAGAGLGIIGQGEWMFLFPLFTAALCGIFLGIGEKIKYNVGRLNAVSGILLVLLGVFRLYPVFF